MTNETGMMIDEDVLDYLEDRLTHEMQDITNALNNLLYANRAVLQISHLESDEDIAALSHADLTLLLKLADPNSSYDNVTLSNRKILGLVLNALNVVEYRLPTYQSTLLEKRAFELNEVLILDKTVGQGVIFSAAWNWLHGIQDVNLDQIGFSEAPETDGIYLVLDEHKQVRMGRLFHNADDGLSFIEQHANESSLWHKAEELDEDELPICLLTNWVLVMPEVVPTVRATGAPLKAATDCTRIYAFVTNLSPHVKTELVTHFAGILDRELNSVQAIGRLSELDWQNAARAVADDVLLRLSDRTSWSTEKAWPCFVAVLKELGFNFETHQFDAQYEYGANDEEHDSDS
ncbi:hypothetical protein pEaSNUABM52_00272 [Erwinia phage pEp_SNUABM_52]|nr:hypothetical protein pEaSNUABM52_00272 [Erwinia phage pEp_SNUABM_52]